MAYTLDCTRERETDNAVLVTTDDGDEIWFPLSQVDSMHFGQNGAGYIVVTDWIARQKGLR